MIGLAKCNFCVFCLNTFYGNQPLVLVEKFAYFLYQNQSRTKIYLHLVTFYQKDISYNFVKIKSKSFIDMNTFQYQETIGSV